MGATRGSLTLALLCAAALSGARGETRDDACTRASAAAVTSAADASGFTLTASRPRGAGAQRAALVTLTAPGDGFTAFLLASDAPGTAFSDAASASAKELPCVGYASAVGASAAPARASAALPLRLPSSSAAVRLSAWAQRAADGAWLGPITLDVAVPAASAAEGTGSSKPRRALLDEDYDYELEGASDYAQAYADYLAANSAPPAAEGATPAVANATAAPDVVLAAPPAAASNETDPGDYSWVDYYGDYFGDYYDYSSEGYNATGDYADARSDDYENWESSDYFDYGPVRDGDYEYSDYSEYDYELEAATPPPVVQNTTTPAAATPAGAAPAKAKAATPVARAPPRPRDEDSSSSSTTSSTTSSTDGGAPRGKLIGMLHAGGDGADSAGVAVAIIVVIGVVAVAVVGGVRSYRAAKGTGGGETVAVPAPAPPPDRSGAASGGLMLQHAKPPAPKPAPKPKSKGTLGAVRKGGYEHVGDEIEMN